MRMLVAGMLAGMALTLGAGPAQALCGSVPQPAESLAAGQLAFVGTVGSVRNLDTWATFRVEEVWHASELPRFVEVQGGTGDEGSLWIFSTVSSNDRYFEEGVTYLVFAEQEGDVLYDSGCSATQEWSDRLAALRPAEAHPPSPSFVDSAGGAIWPVTAAVLATLALGGALLWARRRRAPGGDPTPG